MHTLGDFMSMPFPIASDEDFKRLVENPLFHQLLDALSIGVSLTDPTGTVRYFSQSCYHIYGLDPSESVVGKKIDAIFQTGRAGVPQFVADTADQYGEQHLLQWNRRVMPPLPYSGRQRKSGLLPFGSDRYHARQ